MDLLKSYLLLLLLVLPVVGAVVVLLVRGRDAVRWSATIAAGLVLALALALPWFYDTHAGSAVYRSGEPAGAVQLVTRVPWIPSIGVQFFVGIDGLSLPLVVM